MLASEVLRAVLLLAQKSVLMSPVKTAATAMTKLAVCAVMEGKALKTMQRRS